MKKIKILLAIAVVAIAGFMIFRFMYVAPNATLDVTKINARILAANALYASILSQRIAASGSFVVSFVVKEEGTKNVFGDIVFSRAIDGKDFVIGEFNTSPTDFDSSVSLEGTILTYTEDLRFGGDDTTLEYKKIDLTQFINDK